MIDKIILSGIWVSDQDQSIDFFVNKLGFKLQNDIVIPSGYRWVEVIPPGGETGVALAKPYHGQEKSIGGFTNLIFSTEDIEKTFRDLKSKGVKFLEKPTKQEWGMYQAIFIDNDLNEFLLVQRDSQFFKNSINL